MLRSASLGPKEAMVRRSGLRIALVMFVVGAALVWAIAPASADTRLIRSSGTTSFVGSKLGTDELQWPEFAGGEEGDAGPAPYSGTIVNRSDSGHGQRGASTSDATKSKSNPQLVRSFDGLRFRDQRLANGGNQFSVEPPDQGLCVGNGLVMEPVNDVVNVYDKTGASKLGVADLNTFFGYPAQFDRTTGLQGPFVTDPSCLYDAATQRWFLVVLTLEVFPDTGDFTGRNHIDIAVSTTSSPLGSWTIYRLPVQDDGTEGTPDHHCAPYPTDFTPTNPNACIGDYPHIGADASGFYVTTNEYPLFPPTGFHGAQIYAFSKAALAANASTLAVTQFDTAGADGGNPGFTIWPAISPGTQFETGAGGTEYFLSSNAAEEANGTGVSDELLVWALTNTQSLASSTPSLALDHRTLTVGQYAIPPKSEQKAGDFPLGQCINDTTIQSPAWNGSGCWRAFFLPQQQPAHDEVESHLDSNDTRMQQVMFANGKLWGALDTALTVGGANKAGIAWYIVQPSIGAGGLSASIVKQGYLGLANNNLTYPAIGVTASGKGVMAFTLVGADYYPSAAYAPIDAVNGVGAIGIAKVGLGPDDGFTSYKAFVGDPPRTRWGDYGAAATDGSDVWIASEYIGQTCTLAQYVTNTAASPLFSCNKTRTSLGNWYTRISQLRP
jgi:hypothetical protein